MAIIMEVIHELRHTTEERFVEYAQVYGETAIVGLEKAGYEILGGWRWLTGDHMRDLILLRSESLATLEQQEAAFGAIAADLLEPMMPFIPSMGEQIGFRQPLSMATEARLESARSAGAAGSRPYALIRSLVDSFEAVEEMDHELGPPSSQRTNRRVSNAVQSRRKILGSGSKETFGCRLAALWKPIYERRTFLPSRRTL